MISNPGLPLNVTKTVTYDAVGNITSKSDVGDYAYDPVHVHAVSGIAPGSTGTLTASFTYDGDGNMLTGKGRTLAWTSFDMVSQVALGANTLAFAYDSEHARLKEASSDGSTKYYLNDPISGIIEEKAIGASLAVSWNDYVMKGGEMVALHVTAATPQVRYFHKDHLGSIVALTDASGAVVERDSYDAWGARRNPSGPDDPLYPGLSLTSQVTRGYTGHEQLDTVGLVHMNGRIYDPVIGKMMSADPTVPNPIDQQSYNRYAYVGNNPLSFTDPTGFQRDPPRGIQADPGNGSTHLNDHPANGKMCDCSLRGVDRATRQSILARLRTMQQPLMGAGDVLNITTAAGPVRGCTGYCLDDMLKDAWDFLSDPNTVMAFGPLAIVDEPFQLARTGVQLGEEAVTEGVSAYNAVRRAIATTAPVTKAVPSGAVFTQEEIAVINNARSILNSPEMRELREAYELGVEKQLKISGLEVHFNPDLPGEGFNLFGGGGFVLGPKSFSSPSSLAETVLHELQRISFSARMQETTGLGLETAAEETKAADSFARRAMDQLLK